MTSNILENIYKCFLESNGISTDTRKINIGELFFALRGPNFNANSYAEMAIAKGATWAIIDDSAYQIEGKTIVVEDVLVTLQELATHHRSLLQIPVIGLTGSNGKTTTKELMHRVLDVKFKTYSTPGNYNNHIGVPLTILGIPQNTEIAIIELGANHIGEISRLCQICQPTHGMITNVGKDHLEGFGSFEGSLRANSELYEYLIQHDGKVFVNSQDEILTNMAKRISEPIFYPEANDFSHTIFVSSDPFVHYKNQDQNEVKTKIIGDYNFHNIAAVICVGKFFGIETGKMDEAISSYVSTNNRSQWIETEKNKILMDAYNANPSSMEAAIMNFHKMAGDRKVVILGDMYELGDFSREEHQQIGRLLEKYRFQLTILVGEDMKYAHKEIPASLHFETKTGVDRYLEENPVSDSTILLKASRGIGLETLRTHF